MYSLPYFKEKDFGVVKEFMHQNPFVILCGCDSNQHPVATHVPLLMEETEEKLFLYGHVMRQTDHHLAFLKNPAVLAVFTGPHGYVSASWYSNPKQASTWNYMTVHAKGILGFLEENALLDILQKTTAHFEKNKDSPSLFEKLPADYIERLKKAIIAFRIEVTGIDNVFKLSQNRDEKSYHNVIEHLQKGNEVSGQLASEMEQRKSQLFKSKDEQQRP
jgi:transcriptional regulator